MLLAMATCTAVSAASNATAHSEPASIISPPAAPDDSAMTVSLVLVSPSTEIWLYEFWHARLVIARHASTSTGASHVTTPSMVAMFGWIMPLPLPMPPTFTTRPSGNGTETATCLRARSVVQMAVAAAAAAAAEEERFAANRGTARISSGILIRFPITPVDSIKTSLRSSRPSTEATFRADSSVSSMPSAPVAALAWPAFISTARAVFLPATAFLE
mmetsp:Transcript_1590/g.6660  ORF Transcript_1590/g.6660 Transcript_1590/m.6660 type:complete len:216 (-) Transcript_1590:854-1501(-)